MNIPRHLSLGVNPTTKKLATACGNYGTPWKTTTSKAGVTCKNCQKTRAFGEKK